MSSPVTAAGLAGLAVLSIACRSEPHAPPTTATTATTAALQATPPDAPHAPNAPVVVPDECAQLASPLEAGCSLAALETVAPKTETAARTVKRDLPADDPTVVKARCDAARLIVCAQELEDEKPGEPVGSGQMHMSLGVIAALSLNRPARAAAEHVLALAAEPDNIAFLESLVRNAHHPPAEQLPHLVKLEQLAREQKRPKQLVIALEWQGRALLALGRVEEAQQKLDESRRHLESDDGDNTKYYGCPYQALGELYGQLGRAEDSARALALAADREFDRAQSQFEAAAGLLAAGLIDDAATYGKRMAALDAGALSRRLDDAIAEARAAKAAGKVETSDQHAFRGARLFSTSGIHARETELWIRIALAKDPRPEYVEFARQQQIAPDAFATLVEEFEAGRFDRVAALLQSESADGRMKMERATIEGFVDIFQRRYDSARRHFERLSGIKEGALAGSIGLGHLALVDRDHAGAVKRFEAALAALGQPARPLDRLQHRMAALGLGWARSNQGQHEAALAAFDLVLARRPNDTFAGLGKGNALSGLKRLDEARAIFDKLAATDPANPWVQAELGLLDFNEGKLDSAEQRFKAALTVDDDKYTCPHEGLGLIYLRQGRKDEARKHLEKAIAINPDVEYKKYNALAKLHLAEGRTAEARALLAKSIANYPHDPEAKEMLAKLDATPATPPAKAP